MSIDKVLLGQQADEVLSLLLADFLRILKDDRASPTDRATIARFLKDNGYSVDPRNLPPELRALLKRRGHAPALPDPEQIGVETPSIST